MSPELLVEVLRGCNGSVEAATDALFAMLQGARTQSAASAGQGSIQPTHGRSCSDRHAARACLVNRCLQARCQNRLLGSLILGMHRHRSALAASADIKVSCVQLLAAVTAFPQSTK